jgi:hypothetical protein
VVSEHEVKLAAPLSLATHEAAFDASVRAALADPPLKRQARLKNAAKMCFSTSSVFTNIERRAYE